MQALMTALGRLPQGSEVRGLALEWGSGEQSVDFPPPSGAALPPIEGPFTIRIDVRPEPVGRRTAF